MEKINIAIIGAGVVGLAIAADLTEDFEDVYVFERNTSFGQETSSRNSEVIHYLRGYYQKNSLKNRLCTLGIEQIYSLNQNIVPYQKVGKLVVATNNEEISQLESLLKKSLENGAQSIMLIDKSEIKKLEPEINAIAAIYSPETGIINSHRLMQYFEQKAITNSGLNPIIYGAEIERIERIENGYKVTFKQDGEEQDFFTRILINCAGLNSEKIARMVGIDTVSAGYDLEFWKGEYFSVNNRHKGKTKRLIYPLPGKIGLGIHTVLDLEGNLKLGPNAFRVNEIDYGVDPEKKAEFYDAMRDALPFLEISDLQPAMSGIRTKLKNSDDFVIKEESKIGFPGFVNLHGISSPGLTASPAIGLYVKNIVREFLNESARIRT